MLRPGHDPRWGWFFRRYGKNPGKLGLMKTENTDPRLPGKTLVVGVDGTGGATAVTLEALFEARFAQGMTGETPVLIIPVGEPGAAAFKRSLDGRTLDFVAVGGDRLTDAQTGSTWDPATGEAIAGTLAGRSLARLNARRAYWFVWAAFRPETEILLGNLAEP